MKRDPLLQLIKTKNEIEEMKRIGEIINRNMPIKLGATYITSTGYGGTLLSCEKGIAKLRMSNNAIQHYDIDRLRILGWKRPRNKAVRIKKAKPEYSLEPQVIDDLNWYYEDKSGIIMVHEIRKPNGAYVSTDMFTIPWKLIDGTFKRRINSHYQH